MFWLQQQYAVEAYQGRSLAFKIRENAFPAAIPPRTPLGGAYDAPQTPSRMGRGYPLPIHYPTRRFLRLDFRAFGARHSERGVLAPIFSSRTAPLDLKQNNNMQQRDRLSKRQHRQPRNILKQHPSWSFSRSFA